MSGIKLFESKNIRSVWDEKEQRWLFAVVDVVAALTNSTNPQVYWRVLKKRLHAEGNETVTSCNALKMTALRIAALRPKVAPWPAVRGKTWS